MYAHHHDENPLINMVLFIFSTICFKISLISGEDFRAWTWWSVGMTVFLFQIIINWPKVVSIIKKFIREKRDKTGI